MSAPTLHHCGYCRKRLVTQGELPYGWGLLGTILACYECITLARLLA